LPFTLPPMPKPTEQAERLISLGIHQLADLSAAQVIAAGAAADGAGGEGALVAIHPDRLSVAALAPLLEHSGKHAFVVEDMTDVDEFGPITGAAAPPTALYLLHDIDRGDSMANWSPEEALPAIVAAARTPLTLTEGILWLVQQPQALERNHCFMTIGSRRHKADGTLDTRTPALWISNGTGRDGRANRHAPKVGWCWAGNRHTWLGFATAAARSPVDG
jgi:Family of unknown function (DUF5701)